MYPIVYEDNNILVLNKPAGVPVQVEVRSTEHTILDDVRETYPEAVLVHRLDKDTSGLLMIAKNRTAHEYYKRLFQERKIKKTYIALVSGVVTKDEGVISLAIVRSKKDFRKRVATPRLVDGARSAETHFRVLRRFQNPSNLPFSKGGKKVPPLKKGEEGGFIGYTLLEVSPKTGRTHQVRSHLASIGYPVACDQLYGGKKYMCPTGLGRQFLHAGGLEFVTKEGKKVRLETGLPSELNDALLFLSSRT